MTVDGNSKSLPRGVNLSKVGDDPNKVLETEDGPETDDSSFKHSAFTMDLGCPHTFDSVIIKNSHNADKRDKSAKLINIKAKESSNIGPTDPRSGSIRLADARYLCIKQI